MSHLLRPLFILMLLISGGAPAIAQQNVDELVEEAEEEYNSGNYHLAISKLKQADKLKPKSANILTNLARNYFAQGEYNEAIEYADLVLKMDSEESAQAGLIKGSALDASGLFDEAVEVFIETIENSESNFLLHYNIALSYYQLGKLQHAEEHILTAIEMNPGYADLHLMLGYVQNEMGNRVRCILALHYYLFLEPHSERSLGAYNLMRDHFDGKILPKENFGSGYDEHAESFDRANEMLKSIQSSDRNNGGTNFEEETKLFFNQLYELKPSEHNSIWWDFYTPFFNELANSQYIDIYCKYVSQTASETAKLWLQDNADELKRFDDWLMGD